MQEEIFLQRSDISAQKVHVDKRNIEVEIFFPDGHLRDQWIETQKELLRLSYIACFKFPTGQVKAKNNEQQFGCSFSEEPSFEDLDKRDSNDQISYINQKQSLECLNNGYEKKVFIAELLKIALRMIQEGVYLSLSYFKYDQKSKQIILPRSILTRDEQGNYTKLASYEIENKTKFNIVKDIINFIQFYDPNYDFFAPIAGSPQQMISKYLQTQESHPYLLAMIFISFIAALCFGFSMFTQCDQLS